MTRPNPEGFSEERQPAYAVSRASHALAKREKVKLGEGGRIVIPAAMRDAMGVKPGDTLVLEVIEGELHVLGEAGLVSRIKAVRARIGATGVGAGDGGDFLAARREDQRQSDERFARLNKQGAEEKAQTR